MKGIQSAFGIASSARLRHGATRAAEQPEQSRRSRSAKDLVDGCRSRMSPHAIALSTPRIDSGMRLGSASARARAPSRSLSARSQASVEREHFLVGATQTLDRLMAPPERPRACRVVSPLAAPTRQAPRLLFASDAVTHAQEPAAAHRLRRPCEAAHATAQNVARSDRNRRDSQVALTHFSQIPTWRACTCRWPFFGDRGEGRVRLRVYERNFAEPIAPLLCSRPAPPSVPRRSAGPH